MIRRRSPLPQLSHAGALRERSEGCVPWFLLVSLTPLAFASCVTLQVEPLTAQRFEPRAHFTEIDALKAEPTRPHVRLARIIATSHSASEDALRDRILARARQLGADAVVLGKADVLESMGPSPAYQSTLIQAGANSTPLLWGPWGWWTPFYLDPWSFVQGGADQTQYTMYLSGVAIRYDSPSAEERTP
jgi:hypothetical protein